MVQRMIDVINKVVMIIASDADLRGSDAVTVVSHWRSGVYPVYLLYINIPLRQGTSITLFRGPFNRGGVTCFNVIIIC